MDNANLLLFSTALMAAGRQDDIDRLRDDFAEDGLFNGVAMQAWIRVTVYAGVVDLAAAKASLDAAPPDMTIDIDTGVIIWTPALDQLGEFSVSVRVTSGAYSTVQSYVLTTMPGNTGDIVVMHSGRRQVV